MSENEANRIALAVKALVEEVGRRVGALPGGAAGLDQVSDYCPPELRYRNVA